MKGTKISSEAKQREVLQLLKDYRAYHSAYGGAMPLDETHAMDAAYGPAGIVNRGFALPNFLLSQYDYLNALEAEADGFDTGYERGQARKG